MVLLEKYVGELRGNFAIPVAVSIQTPSPRLLTNTARTPSLVPRCLGKIMFSNLALTENRNQLLQIHFSLHFYHPPHSYPHLRGLWWNSNVS